MVGTCTMATGNNPAPNLPGWSLPDLSSTAAKGHRSHRALSPGSQGPSSISIMTTATFAAFDKQPGVTGRKQQGAQNDVICHWEETRKEVTTPGLPSRQVTSPLEGTVAPKRCTGIHKLKDAVQSLLPEARLLSLLCLLSLLSEDSDSKAMKFQVAESDHQECECKQCGTEKNHPASMFSSVKWQQEQFSTKWWHVKR